MKKFAKDGRLLKKGKKIYVNGDIYEGYFAEGMRHGRGKLVTQTMIYDGEWCDNYYDGEGVLSFKKYQIDGLKKEEHQFLIIHLIIYINIFLSILSNFI